MEAYEYSTMASFETSYWWYRGLHSVIVDMLHAFGANERSQVLDAGCGTGGNLLSLNHSLSTRAFGFDYSAHAAPFWPERGLQRCCIGSINEIPYPNNSFDVVTSIDVLESDAVDQESAVAELWRVTKTGGLMLLVVPAYRWLLTQSHHRAVHASRRYSRSEVLALFQHCPVEILRTTHLFSILFPPIAAYRLALKWFDRDSTATPHSELNELPPLINGLLTNVMSVEKQMLRHLDLPFGSSIMVIARKVVA